MNWVGWDEYGLDASKVAVDLGHWKLVIKINAGAETFYEGRGAHHLAVVDQKAAI
ncbi:unannotated protein [freshwater metagenome]|uniref:Unannotated protein n=1 Tax=freshwater metagenome TaxID=449393 RepID=A0A6J6HGE3_9ZZZZ